MHWTQTALIVVPAIGVAGFCLLLAGFAVISARGGWERALIEPMKAGEWPLQRRLMAVGAALSVMTAFLTPLATASLGVPCL